MTGWAGLENLVLVAGHAIPRDLDRLDSDAGWYLKHFQAGEGRFYVDHVCAGVRLALEDPQSLLIFAGSQTDTAAGPQSEAQGYWRIAERLQWQGSPGVRDRATTEEHSLDSMLNLFYGICRFREATGRYPYRIAVVGWAFKQPRFDFHRQTLRFPAARYRYVGVNDPVTLEENLPFERQRLADFQADPYGTGPSLTARRALRNPFRRHHGYLESCPEIRALLLHRGPELYAGPLPW